MLNKFSLTIPLSEIIKEDYWSTQRRYINLIASSCYPYPEVMELQCIPLQTLPIEGLPENRCFPAYKCMDDIEILAEQLILKLFMNSKNYAASIQPHSGTQANQIVYNAILRDNDIVVSMGTKEGGHISHTRLAGRAITVVNYGVDKQCVIDYDEIETLVEKYKPKMLIAGASSYSREISFSKLHKIAKKYGSLLLADICHTAIYIIAKLHENVFPYADFATFTVDKNLRGPQGGIIVYKKKYHKKIRSSIFPVSQGGPIQSLLLAKLAIFEILNNNNNELHMYAKKLIENARLLSSCLIRYGLHIVSGGTDTHIILVDLTSLNINGAEAEKRLFHSGILTNKNPIPYDKHSILKPSGIRLGVTCITNLDYNFKDINLLAECIVDIMIEKNIEESKGKINKLIRAYQSSLQISP
jgi:glycine hydroxymethyltransferase